MITLGSLFSGSGSFELAGMLNGMTPVWASEIEPYPGDHQPVPANEAPGQRH